MLEMDVNPHAAWPFSVKMSARFSAPFGPISAAFLLRWRHKRKLRPESAAQTLPSYDYPRRAPPLGGGDTDMITVKRILCPIDLSSDFNKSLCYAIQLA